MKPSAESDKLATLVKAQGSSHRPSALNKPLCKTQAHRHVDSMRFLLSLLLLTVSTTALAGYDLHITRKDYWADEGGANITFAEWRSYVQQDKEIQHDKQNSENDFMVSIDGESFPIWYNPRMGELSTKNPSDAAIEKLKRIAAQLKAKVQGDDGELYPDK